MKQKILIGIVLITTFFEWKQKLIFSSHFFEPAYQAIYFLFWFFIALGCVFYNVITEANDKKHNHFVVFLLILFGNQIGILSYLLLDSRSEK